MPWEGGWEGTENCPASIPFVDFRSGVRGGRATAMVTRGCGIARVNNFTTAHTNKVILHASLFCARSLCLWGEWGGGEEGGEGGEENEGGKVMWGGWGGGCDRNEYKIKYYACSAPPLSLSRPHVLY